MSRSSTSSIERESMDEMDRSPSSVAGALAPAPMPSLTSHPPLRLQRKPVPGTILKGLSGASSRHATPLPSITPNQEVSPVPRAASPSPPREELQDVPLIPCPFCPAVFKKVGHLNRHTLKHAGTRFACEVADCGKTFSRLDNMRTHVKNMHPAPIDPVSPHRTRSSLRPSSSRNEHNSADNMPSEQTRLAS